MRYFQMLSSSYNLNRLGSPTAGDLIAPSIFDAVGGSTNYFGTSPPLHMYEPSMPAMTSAMPRRRYSIGGLPSQSMTEYLELMQQNAEAAHLSNLLNETKTSITRSSQILSRGEDLSGDILISAAVGDVIAGMRSTNNDVDITSANILNQLPISTNSFSSHPNIFYSQPNYTNSHGTSDLFSRYKKPFFNYNHYPSQYSRPFSNTATFTSPFYTTSSSPAPYHYHPHSYQSQPMHSFSKYNQPPPPYSSVLATHHRPSHYTSNPAISQSSTTYYFKHPMHSKSAAHNPNVISSSASYLHQQNQHPFNGYSNQHFDLHHSNCNNYYSKLDLDYTKQGEQAKRQVSFNVDVDTLSID